MPVMRGKIQRIKDLKISVFLQLDFFLTHLVF